MAKMNWSAFVKNKLIPELPEFSSRGRLVYLKGSSPILRGVYLEVSSFFPGSVYLQCLVLPLCVFHEYISFSIFNRIRNPIDGSTVFSSADPELIIEAILSDGGPFLARFEGPERLLEELETTYRELAKSDIYYAEMIACTYLYLQDFRKSRKWFHIMDNVIFKHRIYYPGMRGRVQLMLHELSNRSHEEAYSRLEEWERVTRRNLQID